MLEEQQEGQFGNTENKNEDRSLGNEAGEFVRGQAGENLEDFGFDSKYHYYLWKVQTTRLVKIRFPFPKYHSGYGRTRDCKEEKVETDRAFTRP